MVEAVRFVAIGTGIGLAWGVAMRVAVDAMLVVSAAALGFVSV